MADMQQTLRELLENSELRGALSDAFLTGIDSPYQFREISLADHIRHARGIRVCGTPFETLPEKLDEAIQSYVIDRLPQPAPITLEDLTLLATLSLAGVDLSNSSEDQNAAHAFERFVTCAVFEIEQEREHFGSAYFSLGELWEPAEPDSALAHYIEDEWKGVDRTNLPSVNVDYDLWSSPSGFSFMCCIGERGLYGLYNQVYGKFRGFCSERAMQNVESQFSKIVESIVKTVQLCDCHRRISFLTDGDGQLVFAACLSACCQLPGTGKASILDRLRNAVILLSHADSTAADPISLSLSFAAIEALVCEKDELGPNKQIKRHVSTLLVQDAVEREKRAKVLGKLYDIRCEVMHGNQVHASDKAAECARQIAAGVVRGVVSWMENQERSGADASWKEFMNEINAASRNSGIVVGVSDLSELIPAKLPG
jgi:hypothetical protein